MIPLKGHCSAYKDINQHFTKEARKMANRHIKDVQLFLVIREMQTKVMNYYYILIRMTEIKKY